MTCGSRMNFTPVDSVAPRNCSMMRVATSSVMLSVSRRITTSPGLNAAATCTGSSIGVLLPRIELRTFGPAPLLDFLHVDPVMLAHVVDSRLHVAHLLDESRV